MCSIESEEIKKQEPNVPICMCTHCLCPLRTEVSEANEQQEEMSRDWHSWKQALSVPLHRQFAKEPILTLRPKQGTPESVGEYREIFGVKLSRDYPCLKKDKNSRRDTIATVMGVAPLSSQEVTGWHIQSLRHRWWKFLMERQREGPINQVEVFQALTAG